MHKRICALGFMALSFVCGLAAAATPAAQPASAASIQELLQVMQVHKLVDSMMAQMDGMMRKSAEQATAGQPLDAGEQKIIDAQTVKMNELLKQVLSWDSIEPMYVDLYSRNFTQQEVNDMLAFYRSPSGQGMVAKMPALLAQAVQLVQAKLAIQAPQIRKISQDTTQQLIAYQASKQKTSSGNTASKTQ